MSWIRRRALLAQVWTLLPVFPVTIVNDLARTSFLCSMASSWKCLVPPRQTPTLAFFGSLIRFQASLWFFFLRLCTPFKNQRVPQGLLHSFASPCKTFALSLVIRFMACSVYDTLLKDNFKPLHNTSEWNEGFDELGLEHGTTHFLAHAELILPPCDTCWCSELGTFMHVF